MIVKVSDDELWPVPHADERGVEREIDVDLWDRYCVLLDEFTAVMNEVNEKLEKAEKQND